MGKRVSPTLVGVFVLGGLALALAAVLILGSGGLFSGKSKFVLYFNRDVNGLRVGAPVKFRGVDIGAVTAILLSLDLNGLEKASPTQPNVRIPVVVEIDSQKIESHRAADDLSKPAVMHHAIELGLRGELQLQSFVTGMLYVDLDMHPGTPEHLVRGPHLAYQEIPTLPTALEQAQETLGKVINELDKANLPAMISSLMQTAGSIGQFVKSPELKAGVDSMRQAAADLRQTSESIRNLSDHMNAQIGPLSRSLKQTSDAAGAALRQVQVSLSDIQHTVEPDSPLNYQLTQTLQQLSSASRAVKDLADYLERNPSALVRGRYTGGDQKR